MVNQFFFCEAINDIKPLVSVPISIFFFIDSDRGISGGMTIDKELIIHRFIFQPQQIQNFQQKDYFY
jgi:hypothetical protein